MLFKNLIKITSKTNNDSPWIQIYNSREKHCYIVYICYAHKYLLAVCEGNIQQYNKSLF